MFVELGGQIVPADEARISPFDGGFLYGDGVFDTLRTYRGFAYQLEEHLGRLAREAKLLQMQTSLEVDAWRERLHALLNANDLLTTDAVVRITISRGGDARTDQVRAEPESLNPTVLVITRAVGDNVRRMQEEGARLMTLQASFARGNFPQMKTLNYLPSIMAQRFAHAKGFDEACLMNHQSKILEGATSNIFLVKDNGVRTPSGRLGLLPGITRSRVIELARGLGLAVEETACELRDLLLADEVFITGSVKEVVPVVGIDNNDIANALPGLWTQQLQEAYRDDVERHRPIA